MIDIMVVHSTRSGKVSVEEGMARLAEVVKAGLGKFAENIENLISNLTSKEKAADPEAGGLVSVVSSKEDIDKVVRNILLRKVPKVALSGGDGFAALFFNRFFKARAELGREDYRPDVLFLKGGTGNAVSYCGGFRNDEEGLRCLQENRYETEPLNLLEVVADERRELAQFVSFGADGEIIEIYSRQKLKGIVGYILAVLRYSFGRRLYNIFSRNDANYNLRIESDGAEIHAGRHEGGGISSIPYVGYGFRPYPLAVNGAAHIRFVLFGALLMPTVFKLTRWVFAKRPNRIIYDREVASPCTLDFSFDRALHVQVAGDLWEKQKSVRVEFSQDKTVNMVKRAG